MRIQQCCAGCRQMMGTLEYMAPEVLLRQGISQASDVYAWAISMNELATGIQPFSDCTKENPAVHTILDMNYSRCDVTPVEH